jgi:hypothetical protein
LALTDQHNTVGSAEISNRLVESIIRKYIDNLNQKNWDDFVSLAAYALNQSISVHGFTPDFLVFGRNETNPYIPTEENQQGVEEFVQQRKEALDLALKLANEDLEEYRKKMEEKFDEGDRKFAKIYPGNWVYLKKDPSHVAKGSSKKLDEQSQGPYKVISVDNKKSNVTIAIAANETIVVKKNQLRLSKNQDIIWETDKIRPSKLS